MNKLIQVVTLGGDPEVKTSSNGKSFAKFSGAVAKRYVKENESDTDWFQYVAFGQTADFIGKYFKKGSKVLIEGAPHNNNYEKEDGSKVYGMQITIDNVEFYGKKSDGEVPSGNTTSAPAPAAPANSTPAPAASSAPATQSYDSYDDF